MARRLDFSFKDYEDLEGKVLVYGKFTNLENRNLIIDCFEHAIEVKPGDSYFIARYMTIDAEDAARMTGADASDIGRLAEELKENAKKNRGGNIADYLFDCFRFKVGAETESELTGMNSDVIYVGEHSFFESCTEYIDTAEHLYYLKLCEQKSRKVQNLEKGIGSFNETYSDFAGKSIYTLVLNKFVVPVLNARINDDFDLIKELEKCFKKFCKSSSFEADANKLHALLLSNAVNKTYDVLINAYVEKIDAIHLENYELAGELVKKINSLEALL